jgi:hypothetical protein
VRWGSASEDANAKPKQWMRCPAHTSVSPSTRPRWFGSPAPDATASGQYRKGALVARYGPDVSTVDLRLLLAADCPKVIANRSTDHCGVVYPDLRPK